ncbi:hypothetical protein LQZ18_00620 [Lachnospiraceae bacterium ZAX-1]
MNNLSIDEIHEIRRINSEKIKDMSVEEIVAFRKLKADPIIQRLEKIRHENTQPPVLHAKG